VRLHHVQVACPPGGEADARRFYGDALGMSEVDKPVALRARGGAWFRAYDGHGSVCAELHVGVEDPCRPAPKAHPAFEVDDLDATAAALAQHGFDIDWTERHSFDGHERLHTRDGAGNRVEVLGPQLGSTG
jgi:catechol 2,3-dioxygenase-like lactoylglutathione lyase family enzyme